MIMFRRPDPGVDFGTPPRRISRPFLCRKRGGRSTVHRKSPSPGLSSALPSLGGILPQPFVLGKTCRRHVSRNADESRCEC